MKYNQLSHEDFLNKLLKNNKYYRESKFVVVGTYESSSKKILLDTKFGEVLVKAGHLLEGSGFTIESAVDKTQYAKNMIIDVFGDIFDFSKFSYTRYRDNVTLGCKKHGFFSIKFNNLMIPRGCPFCGSELLKEEVKKNGGWNYSKWIEKANNSKNFDSFKVYIIRCWNDEEEFYKIGKTFTTIKDRMKGNNRSVVLPYNWDIVNEIVLEDALSICKLEKTLHKKNKKYKYTPKINFSGYRECFSKVEYD